MHTQSSIRQIHETLMEGKTVTVQLPTKTQANTLRIQLFRLHQEFQAVGISDDSVSMSWDSVRSFAIYRLIRREPKTFTVILHEDISDEDSNVSATVETDSGEFRPGDCAVSEGQSGTTVQQDAAVQVQDQCQQESNGSSQLRQDVDHTN